MSDIDRAKRCAAAQKAANKAKLKHRLRKAAAALREMSLDHLALLSNEQKRYPRKLVIECRAILDDINSRLGPDTSVES